MPKSKSSHVYALKSPFSSTTLVTLLLLVIALVFSPIPSSNAQIGSARWIVAKEDNNDNNQTTKSDSKLKPAAAFEQKWGQHSSSLTSSPNEHKSSNSSSSSLPVLLDWQEWQKMQKSDGNFGSKTLSTNASGTPVLIVAMDEGHKEEGQKKEVKRSKVSELPAEAEEEETADEKISAGKEESQQWQEGWAHLERTLTAKPAGSSNSSGGMIQFGNNKSAIQQGLTTKMPMAVIGIEKLVDRKSVEDKNASKVEAKSTIMANSSMTQSTTISSPITSEEHGSATTTTTNLLSSPFGQLGTIQPAMQAMDLRQLPSLMLLLKQIPTVIRSFNENPLASSGSTSERVGTAQFPAGGEFARSPSENGLLQQFLGSTLDSSSINGGGQPTSKILSNAVSADYGGSLFNEEKPLGLGAAGVRTRDGGGEQQKMAADSTRKSPMSSKASSLSPKASSSFVPPASASPIVPVITTHGGLVNRIEIRRLPSSQQNRDEAEKRKVAGSQVVEKSTKIGPKERQQRLNIYGVSMSPEYKDPVENFVDGSAVKMKRPRPQFDIGKLTVGELGQLERIHKKLNTDESNEEKMERKAEVEKRKEFEQDVLDRQQIQHEFIAPSSPVFSGNRSMLAAEPRVQQAKSNNRHSDSSSSMMLPSSSSASSAVQSQTAYLKELVRKGVELGQLDQSMLNEILAIGELPDLEELTEGMDLGLLHKQGGFAVLKQQFIERLMQRAFRNGG